MSIVLPRHLRLGMVRATELPTREEKDDSPSVTGSYRRAPATRRRVVDAAALNAAAARVASHGILDGVGLAFAVSLLGMALAFAGGHPALVALVFVASWALLGWHEPDETAAARALVAHAGLPASALNPPTVEWSDEDRGGKKWLAMLAAAVAIWGVVIWNTGKVEADRAEALSARGSPAIATIDDRRMETTTHWNGTTDEERTYYCVDYHLTVAGSRYAGSTCDSRCYDETNVGGTAPALYDPANPREHLLSCDAEERAKRYAEHAGLLVAGVGVSILVMLGIALARARE
jgi:hypothetical protein